MQRTTQLQIKVRPKGPTLFAWSLFVKCSYQTTMWQAKMRNLSQGYLHDGMSTFSKRNKGKIDHSRVPYALTLKIGLFIHLIHRRVSRIVDISLSTKYDNRNRNYIPFVVNQVMIRRFDYWLEYGEMGEKSLIIIGQWTNKVGRQVFSSYITH